MMRVKTKVRISTVNGLGLFADQFIPKGTSTWQYDPLFDPSYTEEDVAHLQEIARDTILHHAYFDSNLNKLVMPGDNLRFINHNSKDPNIISTSIEDIAARDIQCDEELTCNYESFEPGYFARRGINRSKFL